MPSQEILKIRDVTPLEEEEILTYIKKPRNGSVWHFSRKLDVPSNIVQKKRVARILLFKIGPSQEILKIRDGTPLEAEEILTDIKKPSKRIVQKKRVARILFFNIRPSQEILKIRDGTPLEAEGILTYIKKPSKRIGLTLSRKLDFRNNVHKKRVARILFFKIRPSQKILKNRDGTPFRVGRNFDRHKKALETDRVARILFFKIRPSQEIIKIRDGTPLEAEEILTYIKSPRNGSVWHFSSKLDFPSNSIEEKSGTIMFLKIRPCQEILKNRDGTPSEAEIFLTYIKNPRNVSVWHFSRKLDVPSNIVQKKKVARILFFKIRPSQEILKNRDGTPLEAEEILTCIKSPRNGSV
ncbi:hypothetical protein OROMI_001874 [Orobanche minor]